MTMQGFHEDDNAGFYGDDNIWIFFVPRPMVALFKRAIRTSIQGFECQGAQTKADHFPELDYLPSTVFHHKK